MRTEEQIMQLILSFAQERNDVRAVVMTGSRANPAADRDRFQDYDVTYLVESVTPYRRNLEIPRYFGEIMILQTPDDMGESPGVKTSYAYLMQFTDENRIDLTFRELTDLERIFTDSLSLVLLDKDRRFALPAPTLSSYLPLKPTAKKFDDCCNEFWWLNPYVAKALYREQIAYAKTVLDVLMREQLMQMLTWYTGQNTAFQVSIGQFGKHLKSHITQELWQLLERTYSDAQPDHIWNSLFAMGELFRTTSRAVAKAFRFAYPEREDAGVSAFIRQIYSLATT